VQHILGAAAFAFLLVAQAPSQAPQPFRSSVDVVGVDVSAIDDDHDQAPAGGIRVRRVRRRGKRSGDGR